MIEKPNLGWLGGLLKPQASSAFEKKRKSAQISEICSQASNEMPVKIVFKKNSVKKSKRVVNKALKDNMARLIFEWTKTGKLGEVDLA